MTPDAGSVQLRRARSADAAAVAGLHAVSQRRTYGPLLPAGQADGVDGAAALAMWERRLPALGRADDGVVLLAEDAGGGLVGFGMVTVDPACWPTVNALHVDPDRQGQGIGGALLTALLDVVAAGGGRQVQLSVLAANCAARDFYERCGWRLRGRAPDHSIGGRPVDVVRYEIEV